MQLSSLTCLARETNGVLDARPDFELTLAEVRDAARKGELIPFLRRRFGDLADLSLFDTDVDRHIDAEAALADAAEVLRGRDVCDRGICLVMAIIIEALQMQISRNNRRSEAPAEF